ncbi:hypothetical protein C9I57_30835 [Trinickia symbiotica]|uniref:Uncharacterized protein n=1 Tax=Trinickia symbiotica TaxID=863227 RepID=A0A2T3XKA6_9BURK|nr:hypothetical protein [Trinickia symbiotica]PTB16975.1 hypothetical protein C9I57_30835 [Trinickia symbiotica]
MQEMPDKWPPPGPSTDMSEQDYRRLRMLNEHLQQAEQWIDRRSRKMLTAYGLAAAQSRHTEHLEEDVALVGTILFLRRDDQPRLRPEKHNVVARIDIPILSTAGRVDEPRVANARIVCPPANDHANWCSLFVNLYEQALQRNLTELLSIGALSIDVALIQQHVRSW